MSGAQLAGRIGGPSAAGLPIDARQEPGDVIGQYAGHAIAVERRRCRHAERHTVDTYHLGYRASGTTACR